MNKLYMKIFSVVTSILAFTFYSALAQNVSILSQHGDLNRTGWNNKEKSLNTQNVTSASFGKLLSMNVDDQIYAQPLVVANIKVNGGLHNVVMVATVNNTVYAFDGDKGTLYWSKNYTPSGQRPLLNKDMNSGNYHDFSGNIGIVGTPAIDSLSNTMYFVARSVDSPSSSPGTGNFYQYLHAIDVSTGIERSGSPVQIKATYAGTGDGNVNGIISFNSQKQNQRPGLTITNGIVYIGYASHGDWGPYHGWILGYDINTLQQKIVYNTTPDGYNGGIWMSGAAPAVDVNGNLYVSVGNGSIGTSGNISDLRNRSESALKLTPTNTTLSVSSFFTPKNFQDLENADLDVGATQIMLVPNSNLAITGCKDGSIYIMDKDNLGGYNASSNNVVQTINLGSGKSLRSSFSYYKGSSKEFFYTWSENAALKAFPFNIQTGKFDESKVVIGSAQGPTGSNGSLLTVSSDGSKDASAILWASHAIGDANQSVRPGILRAFDANDVTKELWNSNQNTKDGIGNYAKFVCPTVANGKVYMATFSNQLIVYGVTDTSAIVTCSGNINLALNKSVTASSTEANTTNYPANLVDGNASTRWSSTQGIDPQWIYIDLGARYDICKINLTWEVALGKDFQIQISDDAANWTTIKTITGNTSFSNSILVKGTGRYVRMYGTARGSTYGYSIYEFEVYGNASVSSCATPVNLSISAISRISATLNWTSVSGAQSYNIQYKTVNESSFTSTTSTTNSLILNNLSCGLDYLFKIQAVCSSTSLSSFSENKAFSTLVCDTSCGFLPTRWLTQDVGIVGKTGSACYNKSVFRLQSSGKDIWDKADGFRIAYKVFNGDGNIIARVDSLDNVNPWNKAGVMFRETLDSTSRNAFMAITGGNGATFQYRNNTSGLSNFSNITGITAPYWVKAVKKGTSYSGYISQDSLTWKQVGKTVDLGFGSGAIIAGIALTSHNNSKLSKAVFSKVPIILSADTTGGTNTPPPSTSFSGYYKLTVKHSGKVLDVNQASTLDGALVQQWTDNGTNAQKWLIEGVGGGYYSLKAKCSGKALDVTGGSAAIANGAQLQQWTYSGDDNQKWKIDSVESGYYKLTAKHSGKCLDIAGGLSATGDGALAHQWDYLGADNQKWALTFVSATGAREAEAKGKKVENTEPFFNNFNVYPNPAFNLITIESDFKISGEIQMFNSLGKQYKSPIIIKESNKVIINVEVLKEGIYVLRIPMQGKVISKTIVIVK